MTREIHSGFAGGARFIAIDWGTTNRRIYVIAQDGTVELTERDDMGVSRVPFGGYAEAVAVVRSRYGDLPILCAGMVGSTRGWVEAPYVSCPFDGRKLGTSLTWVEPGRTAIVPGVVTHDGMHSDVMRGEEVQFIGAIVGGLVPADALLCQPGTHCKWAWTVDGRIERFVTAMTGEMFALLCHNSLLADSLTGQALADSSFLAGVADSADDDLLCRLFGVRADAVTGVHAIAAPTSYVSGLLIGQDVRRRLSATDHVHLLADTALTLLYSAAIEAVGGSCTPVESHAAFVSGILHIRKQVS